VCSSDLLPLKRLRFNSNLTAVIRPAMLHNYPSFPDSVGAGECS
jgi:hypothetical protein